MYINWDYLLVDGASIFIVEIGYGYAYKFRIIRSLRKTMGASIS